MNQGDERKQTSDEVSKLFRRRQNWGVSEIPGLAQGEPVYCLDGVRHKGGVNLIQAFAWNLGTCRPDVKGEAKWRTHEGESTDAGHRGGPTRNSGEVS